MTFYLCMYDTWIVILHLIFDVNPFSFLLCKYLLFPSLSLPFLLFSSLCLSSLPSVLLFKLFTSSIDLFCIGACDGMTYEEIEIEFPEEFEMRERDKLAYRYPRYVRYVT